MSDNPVKRTPKQFEPPPWERDAFEELARKRQAEEAAALEMAEARAAAAAAEAIKARAEAIAKTGDEDAVVAQARLLAQAELLKEETAAPSTADVAAGDTSPGQAPKAGSGGDGAAKPAIDDRKVDEMLAVLSMEEPKLKRGGMFGLVAGVVLAVLGVGMIAVSIWWQTAGPKAGAAPAQLLIQSMLVGGFGLGFTVLGGLIGYQSRQQARS